MVAPRHRALPPALVICDAGAPGVLAAAIASEEQAPEEARANKIKPAIWGVTPEGQPALAATSAWDKIAAHFGLRRVDAPVPDPIRREGLPAPEADTLMLVRACSIAAELELRRVIWPVRATGSTEPDMLAAAANASDRALLVSRLATLDAEKAGLPEVAIETPLLDLTDDQIGELIDDMAAPLDLCWWASGPTAKTEQAIAERERWGRWLGAPSQQAAGA
ncbi:MAG: hypothetical protein AAFR38_04720 [Planctomycetota bacterium]